MITFGQFTDNIVKITIESDLDYIIGDLNAYFTVLPLLVFKGLQCTTYPKNIMISCISDSFDSLPGIEMVYNNHTLELPSNKIWLCEDQNCTLQVQFQTSGLWIFGKVFLRNYFTIFNYDNSSIGFAPAIPAVITPTKKSFSLRLAALIISLLTLI